MADGDAVELRDVVHGRAQHAGRLHAAAVVGVGAHARLVEVADLGQALAGLTLGDGTDGMDAGKPGGGSLGKLVDDNGGVVAHGLGVGHGAHIGVAALGSRAATALDGLLVLKAGVAEMHVDVHETGDDVLSGRINDLAALSGLNAFAELADLAIVAHENVEHGVEPNLGVDEMATLKQQHCLHLQEEDR